MVPSEGDFGALGATRAPSVRSARRCLCRAGLGNPPQLWTTLCV